MEKRIFGSPGCIDGDMIIKIARANRHCGRDYSVKNLYEKFHNLSLQSTKVMSLHNNGIIGYHEINNVFYSGKKMVYKVTASNGQSINTTLDHKFKVPPFSSIKADEEYFVELQFLTKGSEIACKKDLEPIIVTITSIEPIGIKDCYDIEMKDPHRNFIINDFILHNCGKTYYLCNTIIPEMSMKYGSDNIMITSFTRTAAINIAQRAGLRHDDPKHGTLHAICYNAMGRPNMVDSVIGKWNEQYPNWKIIGGDINNVNEQMVSNNDIAQYHILRNKLIPQSHWSKNILDFHECWTKFKKQTFTVDFTDMLEQGLERLITPPFNPRVLIVDEAQDLTPLQIKLIRSWGVVVSVVFLCLDDDQAIYSFNGVDIEKILTPDIPPEDKIFLEQSYRVPQLPHSYSMMITDQISFREQKKYRPTDRIGAVYKGEGDIDNPQWCIDKAEELEGDSIIMASCGYMLNYVTAMLKTKGILFHNPYQVKNKHWNPLSYKASNILYNFLTTGEDGEYWRTEQLLQWLEHLKTSSKKNNIAGLIKKRSKEMIEILKQEMAKGTEGLYTCREYINDILDADAVEPALKRDTNWLLNTIETKQRALLQYPLYIVEKNNGDYEKLRSPPKIMVGTIHSFKGTEADNVFIFPDISYAAYKEWQASIKGKDNLHRLFYVATTRTKNNLFIMPTAKSSQYLYYEFPKITDDLIFA